MTGLPTIVALAIVSGVLVTANLANLIHAVDSNKRAAIAESNLLQAERKWIACHNNGFYSVGDDIYKSSVKKSELKVGDVPEMRGI